MHPNQLFSSHIKSKEHIQRLKIFGQPSNDAFGKSGGSPATNQQVDDFDDFEDFDESVPEPQQKEQRPLSSLQQEPLRPLMNQKQGPKDPVTSQPADKGNSANQQPDTSNVEKQKAPDTLSRSDPQTDDKDTTAVQKQMFDFLKEKMQESKQIPTAQMQAVVNAVGILQQSGLGSLIAPPQKADTSSTPQKSATSTATSEPAGLDSSTDFTRKPIQSPMSIQQQRNLAAMTANAEGMGALAQRRALDNLYSLQGGLDIAGIPSEIGIE